MNMLTLTIKAARALLWLVYAWLAITIVLLFLAFLLQLLGADPSAGFVEFVYRSTQRAMAPFRGMFDSVTLSDESVLDVSILFAIIVYSFVALGINLALDWVTHRLRLREYRESVAAPASPTASRTVQLAGAGEVSATAAFTGAGTGTYIDLSVINLEPTRQYAVWIENATGGRLTVGNLQPAVGRPVRMTMTTPLRIEDASMFGITMLGMPGEAGTDVLMARL